MLIVLSEAEARRHDDASWKKLTPGRIFYIFRSMVRIYFIAAEQVSQEEWSVIELSPENNQLLIQGLPARQSRLLREHVNCMDLR